MSQYIQNPEFRGTYIGDNPDLYGCKAILFWDGKGVKAQFDYVAVGENCDWILHNWMHGWHHFSFFEFQVDGQPNIAL